MKKQKIHDDLRRADQRLYRLEQERFNERHNRMLYSEVKTQERQHKYLENKMIMEERSQDIQRRLKDKEKNTKIQNLLNNYHNEQTKEENNYKRYVRNVNVENVKRHQEAVRQAAREKIFMDNKRVFEYL